MGGVSAILADEILADNSQATNEASSATQNQANTNQSNTNQANTNQSNIKTIDLGESVIKANKMNTRLDELNRNVYEISKDMIQTKGYRSTEDIFRYTPFVGLANVGLGSNLDLRGQGNRANTSVQVLINGIYSNMLDSSHGVTPLNTLSPSSIEAIEILPGGGAVMYGNGTRGGVVNIITQKRFEKPFFSTGISYGFGGLGKMGRTSTGHSYNVDAKLGTKLDSKTHLSLGAAYIDKGGPREGDRMNGAEANASVLYDMTDNDTLSADFDYFGGVIRTTPNNSFQDFPNPSEINRRDSGNGSLYNKQYRLDVSLGYIRKITDNAKFDIKAFYHLNKIRYLDSVTILSRYNGLPNASADQSGSLFDDQKGGIIAKYDWKHDNGRLIIGLESIYNYGKRIMDQNIFAQGNMMNQPVIYDHSMYIPTIGSKWANSLYVIEKYDFTDRFSLTGGARYEYTYYDVDVAFEQIGGLYMNNNPTTTFRSTPPANLQKHIHNYALELTPNFKYSDSGNIYAKYEKGFFSPAPNNMMKRTGTGANARYIDTNLKQETYHTFEIGFKDTLSDIAVLSASAFYTLTNNEFYTIGNAHSLTGVEYGNYDKTQRAGIELFSEQYLDVLSLSESFTYIDAKTLRNNGIKIRQRIPYVSNIKATIAANIALGKYFEIWTQSSFYGSQRDTLDNVDSATNIIKPYNLTDIGVNFKYERLSLSAGVRNFFDTFYYSYYNHNKNDTIAGYGFLIGAGRSIFLEGRYTF